MVPWCHSGAIYIHVHTYKDGLFAKRSICTIVVRKDSITHTGQGTNDKGPMPISPMYARGMLAMSSFRMLYIYLNQAYKSLQLYKLLTNYYYYY